MAVISNSDWNIHNINLICIAHIYYVEIATDNGRINALKLQTLNYKSQQTSWGADLQV